MLRGAVTCARSQEGEAGDGEDAENQDGGGEEEDPDNGDDGDDDEEEAKGDEAEAEERRKRQTPSRATRVSRITCPRSLAPARKP